MKDRDDFTQKTKKNVAMRAGWHCSLTGCGKSTAGPSEESSESFTVIGEAAHICGAASGPGSRRYDSSMTSAERKSIDNAIWLCADHARMIDRDEVTYTADELRAMKRQHEELCGRDLSLGKHKVSAPGSWPSVRTSFVPATFRRSEKRSGCSI